MESSPLAEIVKTLAGIHQMQHQAILELQSEQEQWFQALLQSQITLMKMGTQEDPEAFIACHGGVGVVQRAVGGPSVAAVVGGGSACGTTATCHEFAGVGKSGAAGVEIKSGLMCWCCGDQKYVTHSSREAVKCRMGFGFGIYAEELVWELHGWCYDETCPKHLFLLGLVNPYCVKELDYFTKCDFGSDLATFCDWTSKGLISTQTETDIHPVSPSGAFHLESKSLSISEDSCLEFWYHKPSQKSSEHKVFRVDDILQTLIWSSETARSGDWRQVYIPLMSHSDSSRFQVIFELSQGLHSDYEISFNRIGIRRGQCGAQCQSGAQFWTDETTRCTCTDEQLTCSHIPLSHDDSTFGTCHVASDPHYTTFDGVSFHFVGPCTYVLSRVCDKSVLLPEFSVEVQNEQRGDSPVSSIQQVNVNLQGLRVTLMRRERSRVMVNGILRNLPLHLNGNTVTVFAQADAVVLHTHFKLSVFYMQSGAVQVMVPSHYSNRTCGMCGNFNQVTEDDFRAPGGSLVRDAHVLGHSWLATDAVCEEPTMPRVCSETEELEYASEVYCGVLTSKQGPFSECLSVLNAESFVRSCMFDLCTSHKEAEAVCYAIQAFSDACNKVGITVPAWRNSTFCPLVCGPHSHHNACASGCPETCSSLDVARLCGICEERCECDNGFLLSGGTCVQADDCGCWVNGQHYAVRETFMKGECESLCECLGHGNVHCSPVTCLADEVCMVKDGVTGCFPSSPATCSIYGDPHYITFDGKAYSFWGTCNYTIAKTCGPSTIQFTITARNEGQENSVTSSLNSIALDMEGLNLVIRKNRLVYVNGDQVSLPVEFISSMMVYQSGPYVRVDTNFGLRLLFDGNKRLFVQVDERYRGVTCGLCGTYSGSQFDDFLKPDGNIVAHPHEFASSWNTNDSDWPCSNGSPDPLVCHPDLENAAFTECSALFGDAFSECHWFVPPQIYVSSCISDYCTSQGDKAQLCTSLEDYVSACALAEVFLTDWRNHTLCYTAPHPSPLPTDTPKSTLSPASCLWSCNFDQDECGWEQLIQDSFDWTRWSGSTPSDLTGPSSDHTTGNGSYMYIEGDSVVHGDSARMSSPVCNTPGKQCVSFWYHMYGLANAMSLNLYLFANNRAVKIWSRSNNQGNHWYQDRVEIKPQQPFQLIVEGIRGSDPRSDVAIDDVTITFGSCEYSSTEDFGSTTLAPPLNSSNSNNPHPVCSINCDFESDICSWTQLLTDVFDWTRHTGSTPSSMTGPSSDHTTGSGFYIYIEGDSALQGDTARLLSLECADPQPQCLQFWYHIYGTSSTMGLRVYMFEDNVSQEVWRRRENHGDIWHRALVNLSPKTKFQVIFEGHIGTTALSDVAIDDVSLHRGTCDDLISQVTLSPGSQVSLPPASTTLQPTPIQTTTTTRLIRPATTTVKTTGAPVQTTVRAIQPIDITNSPAPICSINCDFESDICSWTQLLTDVFDWTRHTGSTPSPMTGPSFDHTTGSGFYIYIEGNSATHGDTARLLSSECADPQPQCLQFWYHIYGNSSTMGLSVYLLEGNVAQEVWRRKENQRDTWHCALVNLSPKAKFQVIFEGRIGSTALSDVAIDDVSLHRGTCDDLNQVNPSPTPQWSTNNPVTPPVGNVTVQLPPTSTTLQTTVTALQTTNAPIANTDNCIPTTPELVQTTAATVQTTAIPSHTTVGPIQTTVAPVNTTAEPIQSTATPIKTTATPIQTTAKPIQTTVKPIQTTAESIQTTVKPIQTTAAPVQTTVAPVQTTVKPIQTTAAPIQTTGVPISTPSCPANSHNTDCVPACQPTCAHLHGPPDCNTDEPCVQGCVCDDGFVLKHRMCVPIRECGCQDSHGNNHYFGKVWYDNHCSQRCQCEEVNDEGEIQCEEYECDKDEICYMTVQGEYSCWETDFNKCKIDDNPEYKTFDNMKHKFKGKRSYILVQTNALPSNIQDVYVVGINEKINDKSSVEDDSSEEDDDNDGRVHALRIRVYNHTLEFKKGRKITVDGLSVKPPVSPCEGIKIWERSSRFYLKTDFGLSVEFNGKGKADITLPQTYKRMIGGLCGNFDGSSKNDMMKPNGEQAKNVKEFGESWRVTVDKITIRQRRSSLLHAWLRA
ncbi:zonadhesin [Xyrauchen texanus]|uniref:zonadhesin n=1 Tax=Xyrauchen texanus TaxID=154827 RepID=UPI0022425434|nr:zonadhesin [Xyrauchen texanus]